MSLITCYQRILVFTSLRIVKNPYYKNYKFLTTLGSQNNSKTKTEDIKEKSFVPQYIETTRHNIDPTMVWGTEISLPDPELPKNESEISTLDPSHSNQVMSSLVKGDKRLVHIKQIQAQVSQSPLTVEQHWVISFQDEGETAQCWENPLMGWVSSSDPISTNLRSQMIFNNASEAVYFAKKCGFDFIVEEPMHRKIRSDDASYQDNFLPQDIAEKVKRENTKCDHWCRKLAGTSHYFRPLTYHGNRTVCQHGPDGNKEIDSHVKGYFTLK